MLLAGRLFIGALMGEEGTVSLVPVLVDLFKGVLALFMLELGLVLGERLAEERHFGLPLLLAVAGALVGKVLGLSTGGVVLTTTQAASAC